MKGLQNVALLGAMTVLGACQAIKPYEKEYLLSPIMDDKEVDTLEPVNLPKAFLSFERLSQGGAGAAGTSCPTCGG